ncbi:MAG TPA: dihydrodipicolinate synthase family protein [Amycolatopsis sp.]|nr:dihydrodipicolinate synthase family protein [Amycolatopsis sp.]
MIVKLPLPGGAVREHALREPVAWPKPAGPPRCRIAYAAAHVVADPAGATGFGDAGAPAAIDWDATLAFRDHLFSYGLGVAEAMDTAQRNMGLDWAATRELIRRSARQASGRICAGAGTDQLPGRARSLAEITAAYEEQLDVVEDAGAVPVLMASRQLAALARGPEDYLAVYGEVLAQVRGPVILHWLGEMFDPLLAGYWGAPDRAAATETVLELIREHAAAIDGIKVSLLDIEHEIALRRALPAGVRLYTGDDFHYPELIEGDATGHSDALLGAFAAIAPAASAALAALDRDDHDAYAAALGPTVALSRHVFAAPTQHYKTGIAFLAWLSGHQPGFVMVGGLQGARSLPHLAETFRLADEAGLFPDPPLAAARLRALLTVGGVDQ